MCHEICKRGDRAFPLLTDERVRGGELAVGSRSFYVSEVNGEIRQLCAPYRRSRYYGRATNLGIALTTARPVRMQPIKLQIPVSQGGPYWFLRAHARAGLHVSPLPGRGDSAPFTSRFAFPAYPLMGSTTLVHSPVAFHPIWVVFYDGDAVSVEGFLLPQPPRMGQVLVEAELRAYQRFYEALEIFVQRQGRVPKGAARTLAQMEDDCNG